MTHVSRPFQVGLAAVAVLAAVWLLAFRGHSTSGGSASGAQTQAPQASEPAPTSASPYKGSAPGVAGLTRAIEKARGAVVLSEQNAHRLQRQSDQASSSSASVPTSATSAAHRPSTAASSRASRSTAARRSATATRSAGRSAGSRAKSTQAHKPTAAHRPRALPLSVSAPSQLHVEAQLKAGKVVAILLWNPRAEVDQVVHSELQAAQRALHGKLAVDLAQASQVGAFGSFTRAVQVLETPTILLVNPRGQTWSLTGLTDSFSLGQAISEARG